MRRALLLLVLASCGKPTPPDLSWMSDKAMLEEWTSRVPIVPRDPAIRGKVLILDVDFKWVDQGMMGDLDQGLRPLAKADVGTVVWVRLTKVGVRKYDRGAVGYQELLEVTLIDVTSKEGFYTKVFPGPLPVNEVRLSQSEMDDALRNGVSGGSPENEVLAFLKGLPRT